MIRTKLKIIDRDLGWKKTLHNILLPGESNVTVGIHEEKGAQAKLERKRDGSYASSNRVNLLTVALAHEFGLGVPERSYIRAWFDQDREQNFEIIYRLAQRIIEGEISREQALHQLGLRFEAAVKQRIRERIPPPLKTDTVKRKGSDIPLIDTEQLINAIEYKIEPG